MPLSFPKAVELFEGTSDMDAETIARLCAERRYSRGKTIFSRGDPADAVYIVKDGLVKLVSVSPGGTETIINILKPNTIFGELLLAEDKRAFTAVAETDCAVTMIPRRAFVEILSTVPRVAANFIRLLSKRLARVQRTFADYGHTWSYDRLARVLLRLSEEHGAKVPEGMLITLRITHEELANLIGTTRETVTNQLGKFQRQGLLKRQGRQIIVDVPRLRETLAGS